VNENYMAFEDELRPLLERYYNAPKENSIKYYTKATKEPEMRHLSDFQTPLDVALLDFDNRMHNEMMLDPAEWESCLEGHLKEANEKLQFEKLPRTLKKRIDMFTDKCLDKLENAMKLARLKQSSKKYNPADKEKL